MRWGTIAIAGLFVFMASLSIHAGGDLNCVISDSCTNTSVFRLKNESGGYMNAHAGNISGSSYSYTACCSGGGVSTSLSNSCYDPNGTVLYLSAANNAHMQKKSVATYSAQVCFSATPGNISCTYGKICLPPYACLASFASSEVGAANNTNAHVGSCDEYSEKVCCKLNCDPDRHGNPECCDNTAGTPLHSPNGAPGQACDNHSCYSESWLWNAAADEQYAFMPYCCGDDSSEHYRNTTLAGTYYDSCCDNATDCVNSTGFCINNGSMSEGYTCYEGSWNKPPIIENETKAPEPSYNTDDVWLNASVADDDLDRVWVGGNWSGSWVNYTGGLVSVDSHYRFMVGSGNFSNQERVGWRYYANDSFGDITIGDLQRFMVQNRPPYVVNLSKPNTSNWTTDRTPRLEWLEGIDPDGDPLVYDIFVKCLPSCSVDNRTGFNITALNWTPEKELNYFWDDNDYYEWRVRAFDNMSYGNNSLVRNFTVRSSVILTLLNSSVNFGEKSIGDTDDTTDDDPTPFLLRNDGNSVANVNISAIRLLFDSAPAASGYFRYKSDVYSEEPGSFNYSGSTTTWAPVPISNTTIIHKLNNTDANDLAEIDLAIQVPLDEPSGKKNSTIVFTGWYVKVT
ncbi:MAG: hypothetical protein ABH879_06315 [archaeon]